MSYNGQPSNFYTRQIAQAGEANETPRPASSRLPGARAPTERQIKTVPEPATHKPTDEELFPYPVDEGGIQKPNVEYLKQHFFREGRLTEKQALEIIEQATTLLRNEANLLEIPGPVTICGDIHGQYYDLMKLFDVAGPIHDSNYVFLGDYVDRGCFGIECLLYLYALKLWYPKQIFLLRGNHECRHLTEYFTFKRECLHKYSPLVYETCIQSFCALPLAAVVDDRFFCVHGGISPELNTLADLKRLDRFQEPGSHGLLCDLLWADPIANFGHEQDASGSVPPLPPGTMFEHNATRGCSFFFTYEAACAFLQRTSLLGIIRGHEAQDQGYTMFRKTPTKKFPSVITIFSAPNYLDVYHNRGAVLKYHNKNITIRQFNWSSHPYWLPNFMDAFTWSLPFVGAKITEMLLAILSICSEEELEDSESSSDDDSRVDLTLSPSEIAARRQQIKNKILAVGKMQRVFQLLRDEAERASELLSDDAEAGLSAMGGRIGPDALSVQRHHIRTFEDARRSDRVNERLPQFDPQANTVFPVIPAPSMRSRRAGSTNNMEVLIKQALEQEDGDGGTVERVAERIAQGRRVTGRPRALKRHETA